MIDNEVSAGALVESLARKLDDLHTALSPKERRILEILAFTAADPVTRTGMGAGDSLFSSEEQAVIDELLSRRDRDPVD